MGKSPKDRKTAKEIFDSSVKSAVLGTIAGTVTAGISGAIDFAQGPDGYNSWANSLKPEVSIAPITPGFGEMVKGFFGGIDDAMVYLFSE